MSQLVQREVRGGVVRLWLNRPDQLNALDTSLVRALQESVADAGADPAIQVVLISGHGRAFSAGADLQEAKRAVEGAGWFREWLQLWRAAFMTIEACAKPVIAAVNGLAFAGGLELALSCDFIVASRSAVLGDVHARYGLIPGGGGSQRLPDAVGTRWARWLMYTGEVVTADQALSIGLVQHVYADDMFEGGIWSLGESVARRSVPGIALMKRLSASSRVTDAGLDREIESAVQLICGPDARSGLAAFEHRTEPRFTAGRSSDG